MKFDLLYSTKFDRGKFDGYLIFKYLKDIFEMAIQVQQKLNRFNVDCLVTNSKIRAALIPNFTDTSSTKY